MTILYTPPTNRLQVVASDKSLLPSRAHEGDAGLDLRSAYEVNVPAWETVVVDTGIKIAVPSHLVGMICPRSGLAVRGVTVNNAPGIIDSGYRGDLKVILINHSEVDFHIFPGDRIAQLLLVPVVIDSFDVIDSFEDTTSRGEGGLGSTGE